MRFFEWIAILSATTHFSHALFTPRSSPLKMLDSNILTFMDMVVKENEKYDEMADVEKISPYPTETSYGDLMNRIGKHETERIFLNTNLDTVVSLQHAKPYHTDSIIQVPNDDCSYDITRISPAIATDLVTMAQQYGVDTVFLGKLPTQQNPVLMTFGQIYGVFESFLIPLITLLFIGSFISSFIAMSISAMSGSDKKSGMFRSKNGGGGGGGFFSDFGGPRLNGLSEMDDPTDLRARLKTENISLASFAGSPEILEECTEIVSYIKNSEKYDLAGAVLPRGILLEGPPGTGKTLLAKAIASECEASFLSVSASEFVELFVGVGAQKVRDLFSIARENAPCILFIDEIDSIGKIRGVATAPGNEEREQTLNQLLSEMDGFSNNKNILVLAATNRRDVLDPALLRPGRFDRILAVPPPDMVSRAKILAVHAKNKHLADDVRLDKMAELTSGFTGAQLKNLMNEAAILAVRDGRSTVTMEDIMQSLEKLLVGIVKRTDTRLVATKKRVAIHEAGHAILTLAYADLFELKTVSIQATYSGAGGYTVFNERRHVRNGGLYTKQVLFSRIVILLGGKAAETICYGENATSIGSTQDLKQANELARQMITQFGFGEHMLETYYPSAETPNWSMSSPMSESTKTQVDHQIAFLMNSAYREAKQLLVSKIEEHTALTERLMNEKVIVYP
jgi:cell division protease FtsH